MTDKPTGPQAIAQAGQLLYGSEWQSPLSRDLKTHLRTMQRIAKAAAEGDAYPVAPGVLQALTAILQERAASCASMAAELGGDVARAPSLTPAEPAPHPLIEFTPTALEAGRAVLEEMDAPRPSKAARATFLAMAEALNLQVVAPG